MWVIRRQVEVSRLVERRPDELDQFSLRMNGAVDAHGDEAGVDDQKAGVEPPRASRWGDRAGEEVDGVERRMDAGRRKAGPGARRRIFWRARAEDADGETRFFKSFANCGKRESPREAGRGSTDARVQLLLDMGVERPCRDHAPILGLDPTAGKDELARHEPVSGMPLAHQHPRFSALRAVDQNERRRITRAQRAFPRGGVSHVLVPMCDPNPCMPRAHC